MKKILLFLLVLSFVFRLWQSTGCKNFKALTFDAQIVKIKVEEQILTDQDTNRQVSRIFHNKASVFITEYAKSLASPLEPRVLLEIAGPFGLALLGLAVFSSFNKGANLQKIHLFAILLLISSTTILKNPKLAYALLYFSFFSFSIWAIKHINSKKLTIALIFLALFNFFYFIFSWQMPSICNEIFFN